MADLREKGREFTSEFLLLSSNNRFQRNLYVNCEEAIDRRVYKPFFEFRSYDKKTKRYTIDMSYMSSGQVTPIKTIIGDYNTVVTSIFNYAVRTYEERLGSLELIDSKKYRKNFMPIVNGNNFQFRVGYEFDSCRTDIPKVKAHAIPEPLKVRMITKGEGQNWILKPLQRAMHRALKDFPCFRLTSGQSILNNFKRKNENSYFVSGDYSAATDNLHSDIMETVVEELIKVLPADIVPYVVREAGNHIVEYPSWTGLEPVLQTNGQLMGSLLSFPVLCVANAATYGHATNEEDLTSVRALINGDDIAFRDFEKVIRKWKNVANSMGLIPSVGKNYVSRTWFTINSQICVCSQSSNTIVVKPSDAFNVLWSHKARNGLIDTLREAAERFEKSLVVKFLKPALKQTPRSLDISVRHGGLGPRDTRSPTLTDREINLMYFLKKKVSLIQHIDEYSIVQCTKDIALKYVNFDLVRSALNEGQYPPKKPFVKYDDVVPNYKDIQTDEIETSLRNEFDELHRFRRFYREVPVLRDWVFSHRPLKNLSLQKMLTIVVHRDVFEQLPLHSMIVD